jgi:dephospho-CoA kinase
MESSTASHGGAAIKPLRIGLTGGIGSGKSAVATRLAQHGAHIIDADIIAHALTAVNGNAIPALCAHFGPSILMPDGSLNRTAMRERIFAKGEEKRVLEAILHPLIRAAMWAEAAHPPAHCPYQVLVIPLLAEHPSWRESLDLIAVVDCANETQIRRVQKRNGLSRRQIESILASQATRETRLAIADIVIHNEGDQEALDDAVAELHSSLLQRAASRD